MNTPRITLKRSDCAVLHLGLKAHWYRMIESGIKHVEFREANDYWIVRIANWVRKMNDGMPAVLEFQNGYSRFAPRMAFYAGHQGQGMLFARYGANDPVQHKDLGEFPKNRYALFIGERITLED